MYNQHNLQSMAYTYNYSKIVLVDKNPELLKYFDTNERNIVL